MIEKNSYPIPGLKQLYRDSGFAYTLNGVAAFLFSCTGPIAIIISVGTTGGLSQADIASWIFGGYGIGGFITLLFCLYYRQPLSFAWSIPGGVLLTSAFDHLSFAEIIGAFLVTGALMALLGISGLIKKLMHLIPMPIVMGMVAGVFLNFALNLILAVEQSFLIAGPMILAFLLVTMLPALARLLPPVVAALIIGAIAVAMTDTMTDTMQDSTSATVLWQLPNLYWPVFSWQALAELVLPLTITVLVVQNAQGFAVLQAAGHRPPINTMTFACGIGSIAYGFVGSVCTCVTGPANALLVSSGERQRQYTAGLVFAILSMIFGIFAISMTGLALQLPGAYIATLGGLAILRVLQNAFITAFSNRFTLGAMITFLVTITDISIWNIGSAFWGLVFGFIISWLVERGDFAWLYAQPRVGEEIVGEEIHE